ncbi:MAG: PilZ domain-containing protein [Lachnospiraceae bacterium]|nr:PilZ domain-containing protein [Lachnospiraceae bacterium]
MEERRKNRRMELESTLLIKRMDRAGDPRQVNIEVTDASKTGVGFLCSEKLDIGAVYESYLTIWTQEVLHAFLEIVRIVDREDMYEYGAIFIGMSEQDVSRIAAYDMIDNMSE